MKQSKLRDFPEQYMIAWDAVASGALKEVYFPTKGAAVNFRQRMYMFRKRWRDEGGAEIGRKYERFTLSVLPAPGESQEGEWKVQFGEFTWLKQIPQDPITEATIVGSPEITDWLSSLVEKSKEGNEENGGDAEK